METRLLVSAIPRFCILALRSTRLKSVVEGGCLSRRYPAGNNFLVGYQQVGGSEARNP